MSEIWGILSLYKSGAQKPPFSTTSQLTGKFYGPYLPNKIPYTQSGKRIEKNKRSSTLPQNVMNFGPQTA